jgi:hypothetical protein
MIMAWILVLVIYIVIIGLAILLTSNEKEN